MCCNFCCGIIKKFIERKCKINCIKGYFYLILRKIVYLI